MSSSVEPPDWTDFAEREVPFAVELLSPAAEVAALLQRYRADVDAVRREVEEVRRQGLEVLAQQAVFVVQLAAALDRYESALAEASLAKVHRHLRVVKDQMLDALTAAGLEVERLAGRPFDEVAEAVRVDGWRHHEAFAAEVVAEEVEPAVRYRGALVRPGRVVMGAPPAARPDAAEVG